MRSSSVEDSILLDLKCSLVFCKQELTYQFIEGLIFKFGYKRIKRIKNSKSILKAQDSRGRDCLIKILYYPHTTTKQTHTRCISKLLVKSLRDFARIYINDHPCEVLGIDIVQIMPHVIPFDSITATYTYRQFVAECYHNIAYVTCAGYR